MDRFWGSEPSGKMLQAGESLGERAETKGLLGAGAEPRVPYGGLVRVGEVSGRRTRNLKAFGPEGFFWGGRGVSASLVQWGELLGAPSMVGASSDGWAEGQEP